MVYGGGTLGLMGVVAKGVAEGSGNVIGFLPRLFRESEREQPVYGFPVHVPDFTVQMHLFYENVSSGMYSSSHCGDGNF